MQQYAALSAVVTLPFAALYMAFYDARQANNATTKSACNCSIPQRLKVIGPGQSIAGKLSALDIPEKNQTRIINVLDSLNWIKGEDISCADGFRNKVLNMYVNFLEDIPGQSWSLFLNVICLLAFQMLLKYSLLGIFSKIIWKHLIDWLWYCCICLVHIRDVVAGYLRFSTGGLNLEVEQEDGEDEDIDSETKSLQQIYSTLLSEDEDEFIECTSSSAGMDIGTRNCVASERQLDKKGLVSDGLLTKDMDAIENHDNVYRSVTREEIANCSGRQMSSRVDAPPDVTQFCQDKKEEIDTVDVARRRRRSNR